MITYSGRREVPKHRTEPTLCGSAHQITESLFLGPMQACGPNRSEELLSQNVTGIVNCCPNICVNVYEHCIEYCLVAVEDNEAANILPWLHPASDFIQKHVSVGGRCLVHCQMGVSRSSTVVIAYLMKYHGMTLDDAYVFTKSKRHIIEPNVGFWRQLQEFQKQLNSMSVRPSQAVGYDDDWISAMYVAYNVNHDQGYDTMCNDLSACTNVETANEALMIGLYFILGKGLSDHNLKWYIALARAYDKCIPEIVDEGESSTEKKYIDTERSHSVIQICNIIHSEQFLEDWSSEFRPCDKEKLLSALQLVEEL